MIRGLILALIVILAPRAFAEELRLGVFLPSSGFATNADRTAWADHVAKELTSRSGALAIRPEVFARKEDIKAFEGRLDLLIVDPLFALEQGLEVIAHLPGTPLGLYGLEARRVASLADLEVAYANIGVGELALYSNTVLSSELAAATFFRKLKPYKDASSALTAVKAREVAAAFAPVGHPAAGQLVLLAEGGQYPRAVVALGRGRDKFGPALKRAFPGVSAKDLGVFAGGAGSDYERIRTQLGAPRVLSAPAILTPPPSRLSPPPVRLDGRGRLPVLEPRGVPLATPTLPEGQ